MAGRSASPATARGPHPPKLPMAASVRSGREGFALVSVLWILVGLSALALAANLAARDAVASATNRADLADASWRAAGCLERTRAAIAQALEAAADQPGSPVWARMDRTVAESPLLAGSGCEVEMIAAGSRLDLNTAPEESLHRLLVGAGTSPATADSLVDAYADWRDADDVPRPRGAEGDWYRAHTLRPPRNAPVMDARELALVRGFSVIPRLDTLVGVEPGRVPLAQAPAAVLASLPGMTPEAVARLLEMRARGEAVTDLAAFPAALSPGARDALLRRFSEFVGMAATEPDAWIVRSRMGVGTPPAVRVVEVRLVRAAQRAAIVRRRTWTE